MPVSPQDFELWARLTGNEYPRSVHERAALAPEVHNFTRNLGRKGGVRDISRISYDQPDAVAHPNADSLIQAPVTPDNRIPKVAGTHDQSLTSQHYENEQADHAVEQSRFRRAVDIAGKTALVAGGIAGGVALARNPTVQRAAQEATGAINTHIGDIKTRVSDFLGGMMGNVRTPGTQVVETSGDVTPPTTAQRYSQDVIPSQTRLLQATSGAPPQVDLKDAMSKGFGTGSPTIATSQNFSPQPRGPLDVASTAAGSANIYRPGKDMSLLAKPENIIWPKEQAYQGSRSDLPAYLSDSVKDVLTEDLSPTVLASRSSGLGVVGGAPAKGYAEGRPVSSATENWIQQTQSPAALGYTHTADPFTGEYTVRSNQPWTGEASVADRAQSFLTELQQTRTTQLPKTQNLLPPTQSISDVTAGGPVAMPGFERSVNFDQQTSDIGIPQSTSISNYDSVNTPSQRAERFLTVLDLGKKEKIQIPGRALNADIELPRGVIGSMVGETIENVPFVPSAKPSTAVAGPRQRLGRTPIPEHHAKAYALIAAGAERGHNISFDRALEILTNSETPLSYGEQQAFEYQEPIALKEQTFRPGARTTGQMRSMRSGEERGQRAEALLERYARENVSGLTPTGRRSAGSNALRELNADATAQQERLYESGLNPSSVLSTPTGRTMRNISVLDPEALAEGREEYAAFTNQTTGSDPVAAANALQSATSAKKVRHMNSLFGPDTSSIMLHLKTESGLKPVARKELHRFVGPIANNVFDRAANHYASQLGIDLPNKEQDPGGYLQAANSVLYGNSDVASVAIPHMARAFDQGLRERGLKMAVSSDPELGAGALHTLMSVARGTTGGTLSLEHFSTLAGRARSQGKIRTEGTQVPAGIPGPSREQVANAMQSVRF
jgi:hypothetical protein